MVALARCSCRRRMARTTVDRPPSSPRSAAMSTPLTLRGWTVGSQGGRRGDGGSSDASPFSVGEGGDGGPGGSSRNLILSFPAGSDAGGNGGNVSVSNARRIETQGDSSKGILAQSIGGGGGESGGGGGCSPSRSGRGRRRQFQPGDGDQRIRRRDRDAAFPVRRHHDTSVWRFRRCGGQPRRSRRHRRRWRFRRRRRHRHGEQLRNDPDGGEPRTRNGGTVQRRR